MEVVLSGLLSSLHCHATRGCSQLGESFSFVCAHGLSIHSHYDFFNPGSWEVAKKWLSAYISVCKRQPVTEGHHPCSDPDVLEVD